MTLSRREPILFGLFLVLFAGCFPGNTGAPGALDDGSGGKLRPLDAPDFLLLSVAGHSSLLQTPECSGADYNCEYLASRGTLDALGNVFGARGYQWQLWTYVDELESYYDDLDGDGQLGPDDAMLANGFLFLLDHIDWVVANWIADFDNPTQVVVVAHSHGGVWAHSALMLRPELPVDVLIDLDTHGLCWENDLSCAAGGDSWQSLLGQHVDESGTDWAFDVGAAEGAWSIPGLDSLQDIEDVVPDSVVVNLEAQTDDWPDSDAQPNHRLDGSATDIETELFFEGHASMTEPTSQAMRWVLERLDAAYAWP